MNSNDEDQFKLLYKKYRQLKCGDLIKLNNELINLNNLDQCKNIINEIKNFNLNNNFFNDLKNLRFFKFKNLFKQLDEWKFYELKNGPNGLILIPNILNNNYSIQLFNELIFKLPNQNSDLLKSNQQLPINNDILNSNLRWCTFGYHYNWTDKIYCKDDYHNIPLQLDELLNCLKELLNLDLKLEAGIINYYTCKSKLNPHSDCREENLKPALLSLSLGERALFLIGSNNRYDKCVTPIILGNGDLMIMSKESRLSYHSVIKIICNDKKCNRKSIKRININVRQVY